MKYSPADIRKFFNGELTPEKAGSISEWISSPEGERDLATHIEETWTQEISIEKERQVAKPDPDTATNEAENNPLFPKPHPRKPKQIQVWFRVAAGLLLIFSVGYLILHLNQSPSEPTIVASSPPIVVTKATTPGQRKIVTLPDGSRVTLNADSEISYGSDFISNREIQLEGEAFFEVSRDEIHPFSVKSKGLTTTALGTSFNVRAYGNDSSVEVALASGKVKIDDNSVQTQELILEPGDGVRFDPGTGSLVKGKVDLASVLSWQKAIIHFEKVPFEEVLTELERWYGVQFIWPSDVAAPTYRCSGTFGPNEYLSNVLEALSYSVDFDYQINGKNVTLDFNQKQPMKHKKNLQK